MGSKCTDNTVEQVTFERENLRDSVGNENFVEKTFTVSAAALDVGWLMRTRRSTSCVVQACVTILRSDEVARVGKMVSCTIETIS